MVYWFDNDRVSNFCNQLNMSEQDLVFYIGFIHRCFRDGGKLLQYQTFWDVENKLETYVSFLPVDAKQVFRQLTVDQKLYLCKELFFVLQEKITLKKHTQ